LRIGDIEFSAFEPLQRVIFHQSLSHEGRPFPFGQKLFLRTELVFDVNEDDMSFDPEVARMFNIACYTSIFHREIQSYATELFNHSVACRFDALAKPSYRLFFRTADGISYVTNGHDYWFLQSVDLKTAAIMVILDYFDGIYYQYQLKRFQKHWEESTYLEGMANVQNDDNLILDYLWERANHSIEMGQSITKGIGYDCFNELPPSNATALLYAMPVMKPTVLSH